MYLRTLSRSGDMKQCGSIINTVITTLKARMPGIMITIAPQMTNVDPDVTAISSGFNELVPVISTEGSLKQLDYVQPQM